MEDEETKINVDDMEEPEIPDFFNDEKKAESVPEDMTDEEIDTELNKMVPEAEEEKPFQLSEISKKLAEKPSDEIEVATDEINPKEAMPFDFSKLNKSDLIRLKQMLNATPDRASRDSKVETYRIHSIEMEDGVKYIVEFKNSRKSLIMDEIEQRKKEVLIIPVKFYGDDKFTDILWSDFMSSPYVVCELVSKRSEPQIKEEGEVVSKETGMLVSRDTISKIYYYTLRLPNDAEVELHQDFVN